MADDQLLISSVSIRSQQPVATSGRNEAGEAKHGRNTHLLRDILATVGTLRSVFDDCPVGSGSIDLRNDVEKRAEREKADHIIEECSVHDENTVFRSRMRVSTIER